MVLVSLITGESFMEIEFEVAFGFAPAGDQPLAIRKLVEGIQDGLASDFVGGYRIRKDFLNCM